MRNRTRLAPQQRVIQPLGDHCGPLTRTTAIAQTLGLDALLRAIDAGVPIFEAGEVLMADFAVVSLIAESLGPCREVA